jgi:Zn-dependent protease with chaperone function
MNFFDSQERAHRKTRYLLLLMTLAVGAIVASVTIVIAATIWISNTTSAGYGSFPAWALANSSLLLVIAVAITAFIGLASLYRVITLRQGGGRVARDLGGMPVNMDDKDPLRRRLHNVVEEMALASGVPVPEVFVLDHEAGINAFAAGFRPEDAAIAVTRGALETLNREELQGVIAHEFSHVLNGDMRLNIRLMGPLFGILAIGLLGRMLLRGNRSGRSRGKGAGAAILLGAGLAITGYTGLLLGRLIKAGVSRQREYLADASAVQFTRQTKGLANALKKIGGLQEGSQIESADAEEVSHMLFANGLKSFSQALASHPPLYKRIHALDPAFKKSALEQLHTERSEIDKDPDAAALVSGLAAPTSSSSTASTDATTQVTASADSLLESVGQPDDHHIAAAQSFLSELPAALRAALGSPSQSVLMPLAMLLHPEEPVRNKQLALLTQQLGAQRTTSVETLYRELQAFKYEARLPLLDLVLPVIKRQPDGRVAYLADLLEQLALSDNRMELFEYALLRIYRGYMQHAASPGDQQRWLNLSSGKMKAAAATLICVFAQQGHGRTEAAAQAMRQGLKIINVNEPVPTGENWMHSADTALATLARCTPRGRQLLIRALLVTALANGQIHRPEAELLRAFCMMLGCPLPPILSTG